MILRLAQGVTIAPEYAGADVDCRLLFMGDRYRQLLRTTRRLFIGSLDPAALLRLPNI